MAVVGMKEMESGRLAIRSRQLGDLGSYVVDDLLTELSQCAQDTIEFTQMGDVEEKEGC